MNSAPPFWEYAQRFVEEKAAQYPDFLERSLQLLQRLDHSEEDLYGSLAVEWFEELARTPKHLELAAELARSVPISAYTEQASLLRLAPSVRHIMRTLSEFHEQLVPLVSYGSPIAGRKNTMSPSASKSPPMPPPTSSVRKPSAWRSIRRLEVTIKIICRWGK